MRLWQFVRHQLPFWLVQYARGRICLSSAIKLAWVESDDNSGIIGFCDPWPQSEGDEKLCGNRPESEVTDNPTDPPDSEL